MHTLENFDKILGEIALAKESLSEAEVSSAIGEILSAKRVFLYGAGRSALALRFFTMRLFHLGIDAHMAGDLTTPPIKEGDLLIVMSGSGKNEAAIAHFKKCEKIGAKRLLVTAEQSSPLLSLCTSKIIVCAPSRESGGPSIQPMASLFEQTCLLLFDAMILGMLKSLSKSHEDMLKNHSNLE